MKIRTKISAMAAGRGREMEKLSARNARESLELSYTMSNYLKTGLDRHTLSILIALLEHGVNPEALAAIVKELRREAAALHLHKNQSLS